MGHAGSANEAVNDAGVIRQQLERILGSGVFRHAQRGQAFLRYVVERSLEGRVPKEYEIAVDVFERRSDYDPAVDATVRVEAARLRNRLREYYGTDGKDDPVVIEMPKGGYAVRITQPAGGRDGSVADGVGAAEPAVREAAWQSRWGAWMAAAALVVLSGAAIWGVMRWERMRAPIRSLAVFPLQNVSGDAGQDYLAAGMTDELTTELARIRSLRVVSRSSAALASRSDEPLAKIAGALKVDAVVEGSVLRSGDEVRITAQLVDTRSDKTLWAQSFEGQATDALALQDRVADEIAAQTRVTLMPKLRAGRAERSVTPAAYDDYLRGLFFFDKQDWAHSIASFQRAIAADAGYAPAYVGLSTALDGQSTFQNARPDEDMRQAMTAARKAIELDPENGEAYVELGSAQTIYSWDWPEAERNLLRGIALRPNYALGEMKYSVYLEAVGEPEAGVAHMRRALALDPISFFMTRRLGAALYLARHYRQAIAELQEAEQMEPEQSGSIDNWMSEAYEMEGQHDEAVRRDIAALRAGQPGVNVDALESVYRRDGWKAYWQARMDGMQAHAGEQCVPYLMALNEVRLGDRDRAFSLLNRAVDQRCYAVVYLKTEPLLDPIRGDARFGALLGRIHL